MPRIRPVDLMLTVTVALWGLNFTLSRYLVTNGMAPLVYSSLRYSTATLIFVAIAWRQGPPAAPPVRRTPLVAAAATALIFVNQITFVYAIRLSTASTVGLIFGAIPILTALIAFAVGMERVGGRFVTAAAVSLSGVVLVALGSGGAVSSSLGGDLLALGSAFTWGGYSVAVAFLMRSWTPARISAIVLTPASVLLLATASAQLRVQDFGALSAQMWAVFAFATLGPLVLTNVLWFRSLDIVGPSHATLFANLQPFFAVLFGVALLGESLTAAQLAGGALVLGGVALARRTSVAPPGAE